MTNVEHCPNCRGERPTGDSPCPACGWMPLRATELMFIEDSELSCPHCSRPRPDLEQACPHCGHQGPLDSLSQHTANFHISSLLLLTTVAAVCFALTRVAIWLGIVAFIIAGLTLYRTVLLIRERKRHRYPVATSDLLRLFIWNFFGVIVGLFVFGLTLVGIQIVVIMLMEALSFRTIRLGEICAFAILAASQIPALILTLRWNRKRGFMGLGAAAAGIASMSLYLVAVRIASRDLLSWLALTMFIGLAIIPLLLAGRRGGTAAAKAYIVGWSATGSVVLLLAMTQSLGRIPEQVAGPSAAACLLLWPVLFSIATLENLWKWDDAFPAVIWQARHQPEQPMPRLRNPVVIDGQEEITFPDEQP